MERGYKTQLLKLAAKYRTEHEIKVDWKDNYEKSAGALTARCRHCNEDVPRANAGTTQLDRHLFRRHYEVWTTMSTQPVVDKALAEAKEEWLQKKAQNAAKKAQTAPTAPLEQPLDDNEPEEQMPHLEPESSTALEPAAEDNSVEWTPDWLAELKQLLQPLEEA
ncbi:hypothetical protein AAVH_34959, partial [Aphelenchoides avenae]